MKLGFQFVPFPREIWEKPVLLSAAEFQLLGWLFCDLRLGREPRSYTDKQILTGVNNRPGVGLSRNAFKTARESLSDKKFIESNFSGGSWTYRLLVSFNDTEDEQVSNFDTKNAKSVSNFDTTIKEEEVDIETTNIAGEFHLTPEAPPKKHKASRIPEDFGVTAEHIAWAQKSALPSPHLHIEEFIDYWRAKPGQAGVKLDWDATFRNWIRNAASRSNNGRFKETVRENSTDRILRKLHQQT